MDVGKQGNAEVYHIAAQDPAFPCTVQRNGERRGAGHGSDSSQIGRTIVTENLPGIPPGVSGGDQIEYGKPDIMADHDDQNDLNKRGKLMSDHAFIAEVADGSAYIKGENRDDHLFHDLQHDLLKLLQKAAGKLTLRPYRGKTDHQRKGQRTHDRHDLRNIQLENDRGQLLQIVDIRDNGQMGNQGITGCSAHECRTDGAEIGDHHGDTQQPGGIAAHPGNGRGNKADYDQRNAEGNQLTHDILQRDNDLHNAFAEKLAEQNADHQRDNQAKGEAGSKLFHDNHSSFS